MFTLRLFGLSLLLLLQITSESFCATAQNARKQFVLAIDPGHGGKDPGALGKKSKEKNINLNVALELGRMISQNYPDVKIVYTRKTDKWVPLKERATIANKAKADLFISIHTNASKAKNARGCETFTLGSGSSAEAKNAAMYENEAILLEDNFKETYKGFDPRSTESYIIFELIRSHDMEKSIYCADAIQKKMAAGSKLKNRGVSNAGFLVLHQTTMPSILVELGFITNVTEENYLRSTNGQHTLAKGIFEGFRTYYKQYGTTKKNRQTISVAETSTPARQPSLSKETKSSMQNENSSQNNGTAPIFKIQIMTSDKKLTAKDKRLKGIKADFYKEKGLYKYTCGASADYNEILSLRKKIAPKFKEAFIIAFKNGKKINTQEAIKEYKQTKKLQ